MWLNGRGTCTCTTCTCGLATCTLHLCATTGTLHPVDTAREPREERGAKRGAPDLSRLQSTVRTYITCQCWWGKNPQQTSRLVSRKMSHPFPRAINVILIAETTTAYLQLVRSLHRKKHFQQIVVLWRTREVASIGALIHLVLVSDSTW